MKGINLKKVGLLGIASLSLLLPSIAKAEKVCTTHKNYYFFNLIDGNGLIDKVRNMNTDYKANTSTYFQIVPENAEKSIKEGKICLIKSENETTSERGCKEIWTLEEYYTKRLLRNSGKEVDISTVNGPDKNVVYTEKNGNVETNYYWHGRWYKINEDATETLEGGDSVNTTSASIADLVKGSFLPQTDLHFNYYTNGKVIVERTIKKSDLFKEVTNEDTGETELELLLTPFTINGKEAYHAPAVYYIEYDTCEDKYNATINYYYYKDDKPTNDRVLDDNGKEVPAYTRNELDPGYTDTVDSPKLSGCTIVDTNGKTNDADKKITISIDKDNPGDFNKNVYYYCKVEEEAESSKTGDALIYIAWAIGLGALGYSVYYFMNLNKEKKEEV